MPTLRRLALLLLVLLPAPAAAAEGGLAPTQQRIYDEFLGAKEMNDSREMERIVRKNRETLEQVYQQLEYHLDWTDDVAKWEEVKVLARALDGEEQTNRYELRMNALMKVPVEDRPRRRDLVNEYVGLRDSITAARKAKDTARIEEFIGKLRETAQALAEFEEREIQVYALAEAALGYVALGQDLEAAKLYDEIDTILTRAGYRQWKLHDQWKAERDRLGGGRMAGGTTAGPGAPAGPAPNTGTSWADDPEGQDWSLPVALEHVEEEKLPAKFDTLSSYAADDPQQWRMWTLNEDGPVEFAPGFKPLGMPMQVRRDGVHVYVTHGDAQEREMKVLSKPTVFTVEGEYVDEWDDQTKKEEYQFLVATGIEDENYFGFQANFAPLPGFFTFRYHPACYKKGTLLGQDFLLFDDNASGVFGDTVTEQDITNNAYRQYLHHDAMLIGRAKKAIPWSEFVESNGSFYRIGLGTSAGAIRTRKLAVDSGTVTLDFAGKAQPRVVVISEIGDFAGAHFAIGKEPVRVPVGEYQVSYGLIEGGSRSSPASCILVQGNAPSFRVTKDEAVKVELGAPFTFDFQKDHTPEGDLVVVGKSVMVYGRGGEQYVRFFNAAPVPDKVVARPAGSKRGGKPLEMERAGLEDFQRDQTTIWQPLDLVIPAKAGAEYEVQLSLKKHELLGPITSEWK